MMDDDDDLQANLLFNVSGDASTPALFILDMAIQGIIRICSFGFLFYLFLFRSNI